jgi:bacillithiol system protein YtxJ
MSMFGKLFGDSNSKDNSSSGMDWNDLTDLKQLDEIISESEQTPVVIFKHSTRCSISRMALKNFEREYNIEIGDAKPYFLDLLEHRNISNEIALRFEVVHQSPQLILIKNGKAVYTTSHSDIDAVELKEKVS